MRGNHTYRLLFLVVGISVSSWSLASTALAQRINFSTWTGSEEITINPVLANPNLNFNLKKAAISANSPAVTINLVDNQSVGFQIQAPDGYDLTVEVDAPTFLSLDGVGSTPEEMVPFRLGVAYNNQGAADEMAAKATAVELPLGFYNVTFPVNRRMAGVPGPPPTPSSGSYVRPKSTAWLFLYGELGPVGPVNAGDYLADITINVYFTSND
jgi:hypothetical protein